ncbi:MAG: deoxyguanosinetriphosphate triphosphohydrolase [Clostridia bacterium]|nr:deoxyguanosinetriphosphate triphosphohydrolase [Clostridia bacterium]
MAENPNKQTTASHEVRLRNERNEHRILCRFAAFSDASSGRPREEEPCPVRTCYQRDRDRVIHSKAFRRLKHKTQVFLSPDGDHYRTRLTHTLEVAQIARTIARSLCLNEDLTEAIALGHDLGHTPFGHAGERALEEISGIPFHHNENSLRIIDVLEEGGKGLNLSNEVRDGVLCHTGSKKADTFEGQIVALSDRIAYINHDIDDAIRAGVLKTVDLPDEFVEGLGATTHDRINTMVIDTIQHSGEIKRNQYAITMSPKVGELTLSLRQFMFERVYKNPTAKSEESKARLILEELYRYFERRLEDLPPMYLNLLASASIPRVLCDYLSSMSDRYAVEIFKDIYIPKSWHIY